MLEDPELIREEIRRRINRIRDSNPTKKCKDELDKEIKRNQQAIDKLLDVYQEGLLELSELRSRLTNLKKKKNALLSERQNLEASAADEQAFLRLADHIEEFLGKLHRRAGTMDLLERQKIVRLIIKEILIYDDTIKIRHSIPIVRHSDPMERVGEKGTPGSCLLRSQSHGASMAEIGELLRHRSPNSTEIYAKVDMEGLRSIVRIWPEKGVAM